MFCSQGWSVCLRRSIWSSLYPNIWPDNTTTVPPMVITRMYCTSAQQSTLSTEDPEAPLTSVLLDLATLTFMIIINSSSIMTTSMESCRGNTSVDAASNVCKGTFNSFPLLYVYLYLSISLSRDRDGEIWCVTSGRQAFLSFTSIQLFNVFITQVSSYH